MDTPGTPGALAKRHGLALRKGGGYGDLRDRRSAGGRVAYLHRLMFLLVLLAPHVSRATEPQQCFHWCASAMVPGVQTAACDPDPNEACGQAAGLASNPALGNLYHPTSALADTANGLCRWAAVQWNGTVNNPNAYSPLGLAPTTCPVSPCAGSVGQPYNGLTCNQTRCQIKVPEVTAEPFFCHVPEAVGAPSCAITGRKDLVACNSTGCYMELKDVHYTGNSCTEGQPTTAPTTSTASTSGTVADPAPPGKCPVEINGMIFWATCGSSTQSTTQTSSTPSVTSTTSTTGGTQSVPTTSTNTSSNCKDGRCTVTTTVTNTDTGGQQTVTTSTQTMDEGTFCQQNPKATICQDPTVFGGSCVSGFTCTGDAALCAVARATNEQNCLMKPSGPEVAKYQEAAAKTGDQTGSLPGNSTTTFGPSSFDTTDAIGGAAGMSDLSVDILGNPFVVKFSLVNPWLEILGTLLVAVGFFLAARIVMRG